MNNRANLLEHLEKPSIWPNANRNMLGLNGTWIEPIKRLSIFSPNEFEIFTLQWVDEYLGKKYHQVQQRGGAGDKGRDIVAWIDPPDVENRRWDNYQCKHYEKPLTPSDYWLELGKLCFYTFSGDFTRPQKYYIVSPQGVGSTLQDLIDNPEKLKADLIKNWDKYCTNGITKKLQVTLSGALKEFVENFDFSIIASVLPHELIDQHSTTKYHAYVFGTKLKERPTTPKPHSEIALNETIYVRKIFQAFADHLKCEILGLESFVHIIRLVDTFHYSREAFYSAEALREFTRDNLPNQEFYESVLKQFHDGVKITIYKPYEDGYYRMVAATEQAVSLQIDHNPLREQLQPIDRVGICHQLANEDKIDWVLQ